jgi:hypothetical protein
VELSGQRPGPALEAFPGDPQRVEVQLDRERVAFAVGLEAVRLGVVEVAVEFDDQPVVVVERVDLIAVPRRLELRDREIVFGSGTL